MPRLRRQRARADREGTATSPPASRTRPRTPDVAASWSLVDAEHAACRPAGAPTPSRLRPDARPDRRAPTTSRFRFRGWIIGIVVVLVVLLFSLRGLAGFYTDYLWFDSLGQGTTWSSLLGAKVVPALVFTVVFFVLMFVNLVIADRLAPKYRAMGPEDEMIERYQQVVGRTPVRIRVGVSLFFALIAGIGVSSQWKEWMLFTHTASFGIKDPQFHKDIGFYVFQLPFLQFVVEWLFAGLVIVLIVTAVAHYLNGGIRLQSPFQRVTPQVKAHLSVILALMALVKTAQYYLARFELNFSTRGHGRRRHLHRREGAAAGAQPADLHLDRRRRPVHLEHPPPRLGAADHRGRAVGVRVDRGRHDLPGGVQQFWSGRTSTRPRRPYIDRNIHATRDAFGLDDGQDQELRLHEVRAHSRQRSDRRRARATRARIDNVRLVGSGVIRTNVHDATRSSRPTTRSATSTSIATSSTTRPAGPDRGPRAQQRRPPESSRA